MSESNSHSLIIGAMSISVAAVLAWLMLRSGPIGTIDVSISTSTTISPEVIQIYENDCALCHREDFGGRVGPNLVDDFWINGNSLKDVKSVIELGRPLRGMPAYKTIISEEHINQLVTLIAQNQGTPIVNPSAPQGLGGKLRSD